MQIEHLLRKLRPLIPTQVEHWQRVRPLADVSLRDLLDHEIRETARRVLGDQHRKLLLSLPPANLATGEFGLGTILYEKAKWPIGLRRSEVLQNLAILGRAGAGKTNIAFHLMTQLLAKGVPVLFLDWKRTARHLLPSLRPRPVIYTPSRDIAPFGFNPFCPPPSDEPHVYAGQLIDTLAAAFQLGEGAKSLLLKALLGCYATTDSPTAHSVLARLESTLATGRAAGWHASATRALQTLAVGVSPEHGAEQPDRVGSLLSRSTIIELDGLSDSAKAFLVPMLLLWVYRTQLATRQRERLQLVVVIEEAHHVLLRNEQRVHETVMNRLLRQFREIGVGAIIVDQHPHLLSTAALGNTYATICLNQKDPTDINKAAALSLLSDDEKPWLSRLPVGQGIVKLQDRWHEPFLVQFPHVAIDKGSVSDAALREYVRSSAGSGDKRAIGRKGGQVRQIRTADRPLDQDELAFLADVLTHLDDGVKARYARLGLSADRGTRRYRSLVDAGILDAATIDLGTTRKVVLRVSRRGRELLGLDKLHSNESLAHSYWKRRIADMFRERGYHVEVEHPRVGGHVDVLAANDAERIGIEIETGQSDVVSNIRNCIRSRFERIIVIATDETAMRTVEQQLAQAGLLIRGRIRLTLGRNAA